MGLSEREVAAALLRWKVNSIRRNDRIRREKVAEMRAADAARRARVIALHAAERRGRRPSPG